MNREFKLLIDGHWKTSAQPVEIRSPFNGDVVGVTWLATPGDVPPTRQHPGKNS
jgi:hypothetical protein